MKRAVLLILSLVLGLTIESCGPRTANITVDLKDYSFEPTSWSIPANAEVTLTMTNSGAVDHEWVLVKLGEEIEAPFGDEDEEKIYWEGEVEPGETETFTFTAPSEPGEYQVVCGEPAHIEQGMVGSLTVTP